MNNNRGREFYLNNSGNHHKAGTQTGINTALIIHDIKTVIHEQEALVSEGRALLDSLGDCKKKQQISIIISILNTELQGSSQRLEELITHTL